MKYSLKNKPQAEMTATPSKYPQGYFKEKSCRWCSSAFIPFLNIHFFEYLSRIAPIPNILHTACCAAPHNPYQLASK